MFWLWFIIIILVISSISFWCIGLFIGDNFVRMEEMDIYLLMVALCLR